MLKPSDFYFQLLIPDGNNEWDIPTFYITKRVFYDKHKCLDDTCRDTNTPLPPGFYDMAEACFEYDGDPQDGRQLLLNAGFVEKKMF